MSSGADVEVVHLWWGRTDELTDTDLDLLDRHESERLTRFRHRGARDRSALGAVLLRRLLATLTDTDPRLVALDRTCPRCGEQHGPVTAPDLDWRCSVTHSGDIAVAAVSRHAVGVDIEVSWPPDWESLLPRVLAPGETRPADGAAFLGLWVRKEAVVKATHEGLSRPLSSVDLALPPGGLHVMGLELDGLDERGIPAVAAALAVGGVRAPTPHATARRWRAPRRH